MSFIEKKGNRGTGKSAPVQTPDIRYPRPSELTPAHEPLTESLLYEEDPIASPQSPQESPSDAGEAMVPSRDTRFQKGNKAAVGARKPKLATLGIDIELYGLEPGTAVYRNCLRQAQSYVERRSTELSAMFGTVSAAVNAIIATAALELGVSRYLMQLSLQHTGELELFMELSKVATKLSDSATRNELAAYEMCAREAGLKSKVKPETPPWMG